jgi:hypothetical protein
MKNKEAHLTSLLTTDIYAAGTGVAMGLQGQIDELGLTSAVMMGMVKWGGKAYQRAMEGNSLVFSGTFNHTAYRNPAQQSILEGTLGGGIYFGAICYCYLLGQAAKNLI